MSRKKTLALIGVLLLFALSAVGCENWCRENGFILKEECPDVVDPWPNPGPPIVLEPGGSGTLTWTVGSAPVTQQGPSICPDCVLRYDFIGQGIVEFSYIEEAGGPPLPAETVFAKGPKGTIVIERPFQGGMIWKVNRDAISNPCLCPHLYSGPITPDQLPEEFFDLDQNELRLGSPDGKPIHSIKIQVELKQQP